MYINQINKITNQPKNNTKYNSNEQAYPCLIRSPFRHCDC